MAIDPTINVPKATTPSPLRSNSASASARFTSVTVSDPFVRKVLAPVLIGTFSAYLLSTFAILYVLADSAILFVSGFGLFDGAVSEVSKQLTEIFMGMSSVPDAIKWPVGSLLPALTAAICFQASGKNLNRFGQVLFIMALFLTLGSTAGLWALPSQSPGNMYGAQGALDVFKADLSFCLSTGLTYLGLLAGFSVATDSKGGQ